MTIANQEALDWLHQFHKGGDALHPASWIPKFFTNDAVMNFAGNPAVEGQDNILEIMEYQCGHLKSMKHIVGHVDAIGDRIYQDCIIEYVVKGDPEEQVVSVRGFAVFHKKPEETKMYKFDVYGDFSPLTARMEEVSKQSTT